MKTKLLIPAPYWTPTAGRKHVARAKIKNEPTPTPDGLHGYWTDTAAEFRREGSISLAKLALSMARKQRDKLPYERPRADAPDTADSY
jgi:hypothetical protein